VRNPPGGLTVGTQGWLSTGAAPDGPILLGTMGRGSMLCHRVAMARAPPQPSRPRSPALGLILASTQAVPRCRLEIGVRKKVILHMPLFFNSVVTDVI